MPEANNFENEQDFMNSCVSNMTQEGKERDQAVAACKTMWKNRKMDKPKSKIELLNEVRKVFEKNGQDISDEKLLSLLEDAKEKSFSLTLSSRLKDKDEQVIKILPKKKVFVEKYNKYINFDEKIFDEIINNFNNELLFEAFGDTEHDNGKRWCDVLGLEKKDDGLYAKIKLNSLGKDYVKDNQYKYISPHIAPRKDTNGKQHDYVLWAISVTNIPALERENPSLQDQIELSRKGAKMTLDQKKIALETKLKTIKLENNFDPAIIEEVMGVVNEFVMKVQELMGQLESANEEKKAAEDMAQEMNKQLSVLKTEKEKEEKEKFFEENVKNGKIHPVELEKMKSNWEKNKEFIKELIKDRKEVCDTQLSRSGTRDSIELSREDIETMLEMGFDPDNKDHIKAWKENA